MRHLDLFSGIGGFALAAQTVWGPDYENVGFVEIDEFCQQVLDKNFPNSVIYGDIKHFTRWQYTRDYGDPEALHLLTGGFPCQPFSQAGRRLGTNDDRHLWPEMLRVIREFHPQWIIGENVGGFVTWNDGMALDQVHTDLEGEGYEVQAFIIPACAVDAPHRRDRVWIVAHADNWRPAGTLRQALSEGTNAPVPHSESRCGSSGRYCIHRQGSDAADDGHATNTEHDGFDGTQDPKSNIQRNERNTQGPHQLCEFEGNNRLRTHTTNWNQHWLEVAARLCRVDDGLSSWVDGRGRKRNSRGVRLKALGNAIVPAVAEQIMRAISDILLTEPAK